MNDKIDVINRFLSDRSNSLIDPLHVVDNKGFWKNFMRIFFKDAFRYLISYAGSISILRTKAMHNNSYIDVKAINITHFENDVVRSYAILIKSDRICISDACMNPDFENMINHLHDFICNNNVYSKYEYPVYVRNLKKELKK